MMSSAKSASASRQPRLVGFASVENAARLHLCAVAEDAKVRARHIGALLAFTSAVTRIGSRMQMTFAHGPTALWVSEVLAHKGVELVEVGGDGGVVVITNPQTVLGHYGFREGRWQFGLGMDAALGISRGAVHAAGAFTKQGLTVACPSASLMLTLTAVLTRLEIKAKPMEGEPRAAIAAGDVPAALRRLGIAGIADEYQRLRDTTVVRKQA